MTYDSKIPKDDEENLKRLKGILANWGSKLDRKLAEKEKKMARIGETEGFHQAVLMESVEELTDEIDELEGKARWAAARITKLEGFIEEQKAIEGDLTHKPFAKLADED